MTDTVEGTDVHFDMRLMFTYFASASEIEFFSLENAYSPYLFWVLYEKKKYFERISIIKIDFMYTVSNWI